VPALAIFDLDGTITRSDTLQHYIAGFLLRRKRAM
jgi:phosphatidate phosphatase PAH1